MQAYQASQKEIWFD